MEELEILLRNVEASGRLSRLTPRTVQRDFSDLMVTLADWCVFQLKTSVEEYCLLSMADDDGCEEVMFMAASVCGPQVHLMVGSGCPIRIARFAEEWRPLLVCDIPEALSNQFRIAGEVTVDRGRFEEWVVQPDWNNSNSPHRPHLPASRFRRLSGMFSAWAVTHKSRTGTRLS
jgi:hypothetical protein